MRGKGRSFGIVAVLMVISIMIYTGCNRSAGGILEKAPDINVPFESAVKMQAGELEFEGNLKRYAAGIWNMEVTSPKTLEGLCISYDESTGVKAGLDDLSFEVPMEELRDRAVFALVFKAIDCAAAAGELSCTDTEEGKVYSGEFSGGTYTLTFDPRGTALTKIEIPSAEIAGEFTGFAVTKIEKTEKSETVLPEETTTVITEEETIIIEG